LDGTTDTERKKKQQREARDFMFSEWWHWRLWSVCFTNPELATSINILCGIMWYGGKYKTVKTFRTELQRLWEKKATEEGTWISSFPSGDIEEYGLIYCLHFQGWGISERGGGGGAPTQAYTKTMKMEVECSYKRLGFLWTTQTTVYFTGKHVRIHINGNIISLCTEVRMKLYETALSQCI
jgi:hypothetical protein